MADPEVLAQASVTATLFTDGRLVIMEHGHWHPDGGKVQGYTTWHEDLETCDPEELLARLLEEMQKHV